LECFVDLLPNIFAKLPKVIAAQRILIDIVGILLAPALLWMLRTALAHVDRLPEITLVALARLRREAAWCDDPG
jgi:hypothetical protein